MGFDVELGDEFIKEYVNFPENLQNAIQDFIELVETYGLGEHTKSHYKGKLSHSWRNLDFSDPNYQYTKSHHLWHYHIGIPSYRLSISGKYHTSDMVLHFVWKQGDTSIKIVDCTEHYKFNGEFWLPAPQYLN